MTESQNFEEFRRTHLSSMRPEVLKNRAKKPPWGKATGLDFMLKEAGWHPWGPNRKRVSLIYRAHRTFCHVVQSAYPGEDKKLGGAFESYCKHLCQSGCPPPEPGP